MTWNPGINLGIGIVNLFCVIIDYSMHNRLTGSGIANLIFGILNLLAFVWSVS